MKRFFLSMILAVAALAPAAAQEKNAEDIREIQRKVREVRDEINRLHLLASLELTLEQAKELKILLDGVKLARDLLNEKAAANQKETLEVLEKIRDAMAEGGEEPSAELVEKYHELRKAGNKAGKEFQARLAKTDGEINGILTGEQQKLLETYGDDPLAPPTKGQGEGETLAQLAKLIDRLRSIPPEQIQKVRDRMMQQFLGRLVKNRKGSKPDVQAIQRKLDEIAQKSRTMDEFEYMLWREEFAKQLFDMANKPAKKAARKDAKSSAPELSKAGAAFLDEGMLEALEKRIRVIEKTTQEEELKKEPERVENE